MMRLVWTCALIAVALVELELTNGASLARRQRREIEEEDEKPICYQNEPCMFVIFTRRGRTQNAFRYRQIPSWCQCTEEQVCAPTRYDRRKNANIHTCQEREAVLTRIKPANRVNLVELWR